MKRILSLFALLFCLTTQAQVVTVTVTVTNTAAFPNTFSVNGNSRAWTNNVTSLNNQIAQTNSIGATATNLFYSYILYPEAHIHVRMVATNQIIFQSDSGFANAIAATGNWQTNTSSTLLETNKVVFRGFASQVSPYERTNTANGIVSYLSDPSVTNPIPLTATAFSLFAGLTNNNTTATNATNFALMLSTNATNWSLRLSTNATNFALSLSTNGTNYTLATSNSLETLLMSTSNTLYSFITGGGGTPGALLLSGGTMTGNIQWNNNATAGLILNNLNATQMASLTPLQGMFIYNTTDHSPYYFNGTDWVSPGGPVCLPLIGGTMTGLIHWNTSTSAGLELNNLSTVLRTNLTAANGELVYDTDQNAVEAYISGSWQQLATTNIGTLYVTNIYLNGNPIVNAPSIVATVVLTGQTTNITSPVNFYTVPTTGMYRISCDVIFVSGTGGGITVSNSNEGVVTATSAGGIGTPPHMTQVINPVVAGFTAGDVLSYTTGSITGTDNFYVTVEQMTH